MSFSYVHKVIVAVLVAVLVAGLLPATSVRAEEDAFGDLNQVAGGNEERTVETTVSPVALVVRGSELGIPKAVRTVLTRAHAMLAKVPDTSKTLEKFTRPYAVDTERTASILKTMGYRVVKLYSSNFQDGEVFREAVKKAIQETEALRVLVFFGHGNLVGSGHDLTLFSKEAGMPDPDAILEEIGAPPDETSYEESTVFVYSREIKEWLGERRLEALILHSCYGASYTYCEDHPNPARSAGARPRWHELVEEGGFFAGWAGFSLYFDPRTDKILDAFRAHKASGTKETEKYYIRLGPFLRKLSILLDHGDDDDWYEILCKDAKVHVHDEAVDGLTKALMGLIMDVTSGKGTLFEDLRAFVAAHSRWERKNEQAMEGPWRVQSIDETASVEEVCSHVNEHSTFFLKDLFKVVYPGLVLPEHAKIAIDPAKPNEMAVDLRLKVVRGQGLDKIFRFLRSKIQVPDGIDVEEFEATLEQVRRKFPTFDVQLFTTLEKQSSDGGTALVPRLHGWRLCLGEPKVDKLARRSTFEVHIDVAAMNGLLKSSLEELFGQEQALNDRTFLKLWSVNGVNVNFKGKGTLDFSARWEFSIQWPVVGRRYAYAITNVFLKMETTKKANELRITPSFQLVLQRGWGPTILGVDKIYRWEILKVARGLAWAFAKKIDAIVKGMFGSFLPPVEGSDQEVVVEKVKSKGNTLNATLSPFLVTAEGLIPPPDIEGEATIADRYQVKSIEVLKDRISIYIDNK